MKCGKVKNPCKICFQSVSNRNGLQCKGACKKWAHFKCLNYTPGKISDIKAGLIKITCPCPDCTTSEPKEVLTNPPFTCTNQECPATKPPTCDVPDCPQTKRNPIPAFSPPIFSPPRSGSPKQLSPQYSPPIPNAAKCPTPPRKSSCPPSPRNASPRRRTSPPRRASPPRKTSCPSSPKNASPARRTSPPRKSSCPSSPRKTTPQRRPASPIKITSAGPKCPSCPDKVISPQRSQSCSLDSPASFHSGKSHIGMPRSCSSDSALLNAQDQKMLYSAIEQMCDTVGQLSTQLKDLMCKMMNTFEKSKQKSS